MEISIKQKYVNKESGVFEVKEINKKSAKKKDTSTVSITLIEPYNKYAKNGYTAEMGLKHFKELIGNGTFKLQ